MERNIELRSEKVRNIIGQIPPMLLRYGAAIIGAALLAMVSISAFIPYQEILPIEVTIKTIPEIHEVNASSSGIFIANKSIEKYIEKDSTVGYLYHSDKILSIVAPISGNIVFNLKDKASVNCGELICVVIPKDSLCYYGEIEISESDKKRIDKNQTVILQTSETGDITGCITDISPLSSGNGQYKVTLNFPNNVMLAPYGTLSGKMIITQTTILKRFLNSFKMNP